MLTRTGALQIHAGATQAELLRRLLLPPQAAQQLAHGLLGDSQAARDLAIGDPLLLPQVHRLSARRRQPRSALGIAARTPESLKTARIKPPLAAAHCALRAAKATGDLLLLRPSLIDEVDHRQRLAHPVADAVVRQHYP